MKLGTTSEFLQHFGTPTPTGHPYLRTLYLPYPMRLSWAKTEAVYSLRCHEVVVKPLDAVFTELLEVYGYEKIRALGIDLFGGCFNYRRQRGGGEWSKHAWGLAVDLDPGRNALKTPWKQARFSGLEYVPLLEIFEKNGFMNLGKAKGYDAMHFEWAMV